MNPFFEQLFFRTSSAHEEAKTQATKTKQKLYPSLSPVVDESAIHFKIQKHLDGKYSFALRSEKSNDKELDNYAKWLAGSFAKSLQALDEVCSLDDPEEIANSTFDTTVKENF